MSVLDQERMDQIKQHLKWNPRGMTISDVSSKMHMNRNLVAKYLDMLLISGQIDMQEMGTAKVYFLSHRVPISAMLDFSSDMVVVLDDENRILRVNGPMLAVLGEDRQSVVAGTDLTTHKIPFHRPAGSSAPPSRAAHRTRSGVRCALQEKSVTSA